MVHSMVRIDDDEFTLRVSVERHRRSLTLPMSPLLIIDGLSRKCSSYSKLPDEPINLSVVKLDGSFFDIHVTKTATVAQLKQAVEAVFSHMPQNGPGKISWPHVWGHFCLCFNGQKLIIETDCIRGYGIRDGDRLHFIRHVSINFSLMESKKEIVASEQQRTSCSPSVRSPSISHEEEKNDKDYYHVVDIEKGKLQHYDDEGFLEEREKTRLTRLIGRWFPRSRLVAVEKRRIQELAFPSRLTTSLLGGFRKIVRLCCDKCYTRRGGILLCCDSQYRRRSSWRRY